MDEDIEYITRDDVNRAILREMARIKFRERIQIVMIAVARELVAAGVDFSGVDYSKLSAVTNKEIDQIYEELF